MTDKHNLHKGVLLCGSPCSDDDSLDNISLEKWTNIKQKSVKWKELDKFGHVYPLIKWEHGPKGYYRPMLYSCYATLSSKRALSQAESRQHKRENSESRNDEENDKASQGCSSSKRLRSVIGTVHNKELCVWCMKGQFKSSDESKKLLLLSTLDAWTKFKLHTIRLEDEDLKNRLNTMIVSIPDPQTAFGLKVRYHRGCWRKHISDKKPLTEEDEQHLQSVSLRETQELFFNHVRQAIFEKHGIRSVQSILQDYTRIISNFGYESIVKSSYIKDILMKEFTNDTGFHKSCHNKNSELIYDTRGADSYLEAAMSSLGVDTLTLLWNISQHLNDEIKNTDTVPWPPYIHELEQKESISSNLVKFLTWLKNPTKQTIDTDPIVQSIGSIITSYLTGKQTIFVTNLAILIHGMTKSKEIIYNWHFA